MDDFEKMAHFSPLAKSPATKISQQINLTGNARIVRDLAATIHASIQQWKNVHLHGLSLLKAITQLKIDARYPEGLEYLCEDLEKDCDKLDDIACNLKQAAVQMNAVKSLHRGTNKLFQTWTIDRFAHIVEQISEAYEKEAEIKRVVMENVAHDHREPWKMLHLATWVHQTQIPESVTTTLESMLLETGHR